MSTILLNDIIMCIKSTIIDGLEEVPDKFPIFKEASSLMCNINNYNLKDFDDKLFENIIREISNYLID